MAVESKIPRIEPCPYCTSKTACSLFDIGYYVQCKCGARSKTFHKKQEAIDIWNSISKIYRGKGSY